MEKDKKILLKPEKSRTKLDNLSKALRENLLRRKKIHKGKLKESNASEKE